MLRFLCKSEVQLRKLVVQMVEGFVFVAGLVGFEVLAARFGKSTRDAEDWFTHAGPTAVNE